MSPPHPPPAGSTFSSRRRLFLFPLEVIHLFIVCKSLFSFHHRLPGFLIVGSFPGKNKKSLFPLLGEQGQNNEILRYHLVCRLQIDRSARCQHTVCQITPALRQRILETSLSPCPRRPICCSAFRPALSSAGLSVDALAALLPRLRFGI